MHTEAWSAMRKFLLVFALALPFAAAAKPHDHPGKAGAPPPNHRGHVVPEFDLAAVGAIGAIVAGGGVLLARRRRR